MGERGRGTKGRRRRAYRQIPYTHVYTRRPRHSRPVVDRVSGDRRDGASYLSPTQSSNFETRGPVERENKNKRKTVHSRSTVSVLVGHGSTVNVELHYSS